MKCSVPEDTSFRNIVLKKIARNTPIKINILNISQLLLMSVTTKSLSSPILANKMRVNHFVFFSTLLIVVIIGSVILAFTKIDISSQSKGITRSIQESTYVSSLQNGIINSHNIVPNKNVQKGDTLLILSQDRIQSQAVGQDSLL